MANQFNIDRTIYDIGSPLVSFRTNNGVISLTQKGLVYSLDSGTRYTITFSKLISLLKANVYDPNNVEVRDNINDILSQYKHNLEKHYSEAEQRMKKYDELFNNLNSQKNG